MTQDIDKQQSLLARVKRGDAGALAAAFEQSRDRLHTIVRFRLDRRLAGRVDADDVLQEAYLSAAKRFAHVEGETDDALFVWLRLITIQTMADIYRRHIAARKRDAGREAGPATGAGGSSTSMSLAAGLVGAMTTPTGRIRRMERAEQVAAALDQMSDVDREVIALRHFEELTNQEVAQVLGIEPKAASIRYVRALRRLKEALADFPDLPLSMERPPPR